MSTAPNAPPVDTALEHALALAGRGLRVLPIRPGGKHPPMKAWQHAATTDPKTIRNWWNGLYRDHGVGIAMGRHGNAWIFTLDVDEHDPAVSGADTLAELEAAHGALPDTVRSITGSGGAHHLFTAPFEVTNGAAGAVGPGLDIRGEGGQIVVAPTIHPNGRAYNWEHGHAPWEHDIAPAPGWLLEKVRPPERQPVVPQVNSEASHALGAPFDSGMASPADTLRSNWDWPTELTNRGWQQNRADPEKWTRPGKDPRLGTSAVLHGTDGPFVVFTTDVSAQTMWRAGKVTRDGSGVSLSPLAFLAAYDHAGDLSAASTALRATYGITDGLTALIAPDDATANHTAPVDVRDGLRAMLINWPEFWSQDHGEATWLVEPLIAARRSHALFAPGGTGKSLLALWLAAQLATGRTMFGNTRDPINVLYLDYEMTADDLAERLEAMGYSASDNLTHLHYALLPALPGLDQPEGGKAVVALAALVDADLVVIDTFGRAVHGDENDADTVRAWYRWTGIHLKAAERAFLRVDHAGKDIEKGQRGTSAKNDDVDVVWQATRIDAGLALKARKKRMGWVPDAVTLTINEDPHFTYALAGGTTYPAGTKELADELDALGIAVSDSARAAAKAYRAAGRAARSEAIRMAQKWRRQALPELTGGPHPAVQAVMDADGYGSNTRADSVGARSGARFSDDPPGASAGATPQQRSDQVGRGAGRGGARSSRADGARPVSLDTGAHPAPDPEPII